MKRVLKSRLTACVLVLLIVAIGIAFAGDVIVKQGDMDVSGDTDIDGDLDVAGEITNSGGWVSVGDNFWVDGFTVLYSGLIVDGSALLDCDTVINGDLFVYDTVSADDYLEHSTFYDKEVYGRALDYLTDSSEIITINDQGKKEYDHAVDPVFLQRWVEVKDPNAFTEVEIWDEERQTLVKQRVYETHEELHSSLSMKVAWLRQCAYELKQENNTLKTELAAIKAKLGIQ